MKGRTTHERKKNLDRIDKIHHMNGFQGVFSKHGHPVELVHPFQPSLGYKARLRFVNSVNASNEIRESAMARDDRRRWFQWVFVWAALGLLMPVQGFVPARQSTKPKDKPQPPSVSGGASAAAPSTQEQLPADPAPARAESGQSLVVPEDQLDVGDVYHVYPGEDTQLTAISDAPLRRVVLTTCRVVGYIVVPFEFKPGDKLMAAGAFRVPIASLTSGISDLDDQLYAPTGLDSAKFPEATFLVTNATPAESAGDEHGFAQYTFTLTGKLTMRGASKELSFPVRAAVIPSTMRRTFMARYPGDFVSLRASFEIKPADFNWKRGRMLSADVFADTLRVDVCLFTNNIPVEKSLDPGVTIQARTQELKLLTLLRDFNDPLKGYALAREQLKQAEGDAARLGRLAYMIAGESGVRRRDLTLAMEAAQAACKLSEDKDFTALGALARVHYERGDLAAAVAWARKAFVAVQNNPFAAGPVQQALAKYEAEARAAGISLETPSAGTEGTSAGKASGAD